MYERRYCYIFKYTQLGFYRYGNDDYCEPLEMDTLLSSLHVWFQDRISLEDTLLWDDETPGYSHRKKVYLKAIEKMKKRVNISLFFGEP